MSVFNTVKEAIIFEAKLIDDLDAVNSDEYYNRQNKGEKFNILGLPRTEKQQAAVKRNGQSKTNIERLIKLTKNPEFIEINRSTLLKQHNNPKRIEAVKKYTSSDICKEHLKRINNDEDLISRRDTMNSSIQHLDMLKMNRESEAFKLGLETHRRSKENKDHLARIKNSISYKEAVKRSSTSVENICRLKDLLSSDKRIDNFNDYKKSEKSKSIDRANISKAHESNMKKVMNLITGKIYLSATHAANENSVSQ